jgi:hypothetical protein
MMWDVVAKRMYIGLNGNQEGKALNQTAWLYDIEDLNYGGCGVEIANDPVADETFDSYWGENLIVKARIFPTTSTYTVPTNLITLNTFSFAAVTPAGSTFGAITGASSDAHWVVDTTTSYAWSGTAWSTDATSSLTRTVLCGSAGVPNDAYYFGGSTTSTETYNGTAFSSGPTMTANRNSSGGTGTANAALCSGGSATSSCEEFEGTAWASGGAMALTEATIIVGGTLNDGIAIGDSLGGATYDGTTWTTSSTGLTTTAWNTNPGIGGWGDIANGFVACRVGPNYNTPQFFSNDVWTTMATLPLGVADNVGAGAGAGAEGFIPGATDEGTGGTGVSLFYQPWLADADLGQGWL